jgi:hypothetical protein
MKTSPTSSPTRQSLDWLQKDIPLFECPDREVEEMYYFRWWSFRKHLVSDDQRLCVHGIFDAGETRRRGQHQRCAAGFHLAEGRWLHDQNYLDDYVPFLAARQWWQAAVALAQVQQLVRRRRL